MVANLLRQIFSGGDAQLRRHHLNQHRHQVSPYHHPQQLVAKAGTGLDVGGEVTRIDIADGSNERRPHQGELNLARCATAAILNATVCHFLPLEI